MNIYLGIAIWVHLMSAMMTDTPCGAPENIAPKKSAQPNKTERAFVK
jgi:hypothetical protein